MFTQNSFKTPSQAFDRLHIAYLAIVGGSMLAFLLVYLQTEKIAPANPAATQLISVFNYVVPLVCILLIGFAIILLKQRFKHIGTAQNLADKVNIYLKTKILQFAILEGAALFAAAIYFITAFKLYLIYFFAAMITLHFQKPSMANFAKEVQLKDTEIEALKANKFA